MQRITMKDVASVMGVSVMTVSNAFNRPDQLSGDLRERILQRAAKMGYAGPDAAARHLRSGRTNCYAVIFSEQLSYAFSDPFSVLWLTAFTQVMEQHRASVLLLSVTASDEAARSAIQDTSADGIAGLCPDQLSIELARERGLRTVVNTLAHRVGDPRNDRDHVVIDDFQAGVDLADHLRRLGHSRIDVILDEPIPGDEPRLHTPEELAAKFSRHDSLNWFDSWTRLQGILRGLAGAEIRILSSGRNQRPAAREAAGLSLDRQDRPTAVIGLSDVLALGFMDACAGRGIEVGAEVSVAGFDDLPEAAAAGLTTIAQPIQEKGRLTAELLLDPQRQPRQILLPHRLVPRASTRPAP